MYGVRDATEAEWKIFGLVAEFAAIAKLVHDEYDGRDVPEIGSIKKSSILIRIHG